MSSFAFRPGWSPLNIALMVGGFILFWPLGLVMLAYIIWGHRWPAIADDARRTLAMAGNGRCAPVFPGMRPGAAGTWSATGNVAFDEYRQREIARLEEERRKLDAMREEFDDYLRELRRAKDREEFDRFMNARRNRMDAEPNRGETGGGAPRPSPAA